MAEAPHSRYFFPGDRGTTKTGLRIFFQISEACNILPEFMHRFFAVTDISVTFGFYNVLMNRKTPQGHPCMSWNME
ncbi:hypothetical protein D5278_09055 [bacterium 1XD21-13]|nr:hypothetical protein [bacterium 1XD21-13]